MLLKGFGHLLRKRQVMYPIIYLGIVGAGGRFVGSNPGSTPQELAHMLNLTSTRYVLVSPPLLPSLLQATTNLSVPIPNTNIFIFDTPHNPSTPPGFQSWKELLENGEGSWKAFIDVKSSKETIASLFSTSGTTGLPKVAAVSHYASIARCIASYDPKPKDYPVSRLMCLPMFHGVAATASHIGKYSFNPKAIFPLLRA
jgi:long-subunit acyl-CoA synthetase (AMP-forming)